MPSLGTCQHGFRINDGERCIECRKMIDAFKSEPATTTEPTLLQRAETAERERDEARAALDVTYSQGFKAGTEAAAVHHDDQRAKQLNWAEQAEDSGDEKARDRFVDYAEHNGLHAACIRRLPVPTTPIVSDPTPSGNRQREGGGYRGGGEGS